MLAMFVLSLSSIVSAHEIQGNWANASYQMYAGNDEPPQLPQPDQRKHKPQPPQPPDQHDPR